MAHRLLSKSKYLNSLQCPKYLWILLNQREKVPEPDIGLQYVFDQGHRVGVIATKLYPNGIHLNTDSFQGNIRQTIELLKQRVPLFEAGILSNNIYSRIDILNPAGKYEWDIIEVKSTTSVKDVNLHDVSFQKICCEKTGLKINKCFLAHINNKYVKDGDINPNEFFTIEDITLKVAEVTEGLEERIEYSFDVISQKVCPDMSIGRHCNKPYFCPLEEQCWSFLPNNSVLDLRGGKMNALKLYNKGILLIKDIPDDVKLSRQQQIQKECIISGEPHIQKEEIREFLNTLIYPLYYLDFETMGPAIPLFDGTKPYQTIPFQFSLHIAENKESKPVHFSYLAKGREDPRSQFLSELKKLLGSKGSIIAYNSGFEEGVLNDLVKEFPEYSDWLEGILNRIVDLLTPFSNYHFYHPIEKGSASLKGVLPAVTGRSYEEMNIGAGMDASNLYEQVTYGDVDEETREKVRTDLLEYCKLDTEGMIWIVEKLREMAV